MSLLWMDGFDVYGTDGQDIGPVMESALYTHALCKANAATRSGTGYCVQLPYNSNSGSTMYIRKAFVTKSALVVGFAMKLNSILELKQLCEFQYDNHFGSIFSHFGVFMTGDGAVSVGWYETTDDGLITNKYKLFDSGPNLLFPNVWHYVEVKISFHESAGFVQVKVDGQTCVSGTGRTKNPAAPALCNILKITNFRNEDASFNDYFIDDLYICDQSGSAFNDFLGDVVVLAALPNADAGPNQTSKVGGSVDHYTAVDEIPPDEDTSYLYSNTIGHQELFSIGTLPSNVINVLAVSVHARVKKDAAGTANLKMLCKTGTDLASGSIQPVTTQYVTRAEIFTSAPDATAWTKVKAQGMKIGFEVD